MSLLLRAWYEAGYAMGQAHADQVSELVNLDNLSQLFMVR